MDRDRLWRRTGPRVRTIAQAARFISDVGFAHLFPGKTPGPDLWSATADDPRAAMDWGPDAERVWGWKDELPERGLSWFGWHTDHKVFLSPALLALLYPADDRAAMETLSEDARAIWLALERSGSLSQAALKEAVRMDTKAAAPRFGRAIRDLGRQLLLTHRGVEEQGAGWPSVVFDLTARVFDVPARGDDEARRADAAATYLATMREVTPRTLGKAFGWRVPAARAVLAGLVAAGRAGRDGDTFTPAPPPHARRR